MINKANIDRVIAAIENEENHFSMADYVGWDEGKECATPGCICGWANALRNKDNRANSFNIYSPNRIKLSDETAARKFLGIDVYQAMYLFKPTHKPWGHITRAEAIKALERLRDTGEVWWA